MLSWIARLFGAAPNDAADRATAAVRDIADMLERARDDLRERLGYHAEAPQLETTPDPEPANGRKVRRVRADP